MDVLTTRRVILRRLQSADLAPLAVLYADPQIRRFFPDGVRTLAETEEELDWFRDGHPDFPELGLWAMIDRHSQAFIGRCGLLPWTIAGVAEVEIAYLLDPAYWGRGLGTEIAKALVAHGFGQLQLPRLIALIDPGNHASIRVAEAAGLCFERHEVVDGSPCDLYAISSKM